MEAMFLRNAAQRCSIHAELESVLLLYFFQSSSSGMCVLFLCRPPVFGWLCDHGSAEPTRKARVEALD
jgi:hypothetical protein